MLLNYSLSGIYFFSAVESGSSLHEVGQIRPDDVDNNVILFAHGQIL